MRVLRTLLALLIVLHQLGCAATAHREVRASSGEVDPFPDVTIDEVLESVQTADSVLIYFDSDGGRYNRVSGRIVGMSRATYADELHGREAARVDFDVHAVSSLQIRGSGKDAAGYSLVLGAMMMILVMLFLDPSY